jgi:hypothetical protein
MVTVVTNGRIYHYPFKVKELVMINRELRDDFSKVAKELKINKSKLIQEVYKQFIIGFNTGTLKVGDRNTPIVIKRSAICKGK